MRAVIQRVSEASVSIGDNILAGIKQGLVVLLAVGTGDTTKDIDYIVDKTVNMRIFENNDKFDLSLKDIGGEGLLISQFTLFGDVRKGRRPSFTEACAPSEARLIYEKVFERFLNEVPAKQGVFQAYMQVNLQNDGPVTILLDSKKLF
jgi:D-aminoacyl-tRNA deacylase